MIRYYTWKQDAFVEQNQEVEQAQWLSVEQPTETEINTLIAKYQLPKDYLTSVLDVKENSRLEGLDHNQLNMPVLLLLQYPSAIKSPSGYQQFTIFPLAIILTSDQKIITVTNQSVPFLDKLKHTTFSNQLAENDSLSVALLVTLHLSLQISLLFNQFLKQILTHTNRLEGQLKVATENNQLYQLMDIQKSLVYFEFALSSNLHVFQTLYEAKDALKPEKNFSHLHDVLVETKQALVSTKIQLQIVDKISDTFSAIVSNNLNNVMKILTSLTIVLTIPTIIGGIFGMNVTLPFANREDAFLWIFVITTSICIFTIYRLKKKNLL